MKSKERDKKAKGPNPPRSLKPGLEERCPRCHRSGLARIAKRCKLCNPHVR